MSLPSALRRQVVKERSILFGPTFIFTLLVKDINDAVLKNLYWKDMISPHFDNDKLCYDVFDFKDQTQCHVTVWDAPRGNNTQHIPCFGFQILWTWYEIINHKHGVFEVKRKALCRASQVHFTGEKSQLSSTLM